MTKPKNPKNPKNSDTNCTVRGYRYWRGSVKLSERCSPIYGKNYGDWKKKRDEAIRNDALGLITTTSTVGAAFGLWLYDVVQHRNIKSTTFYQYERIYIAEIKDEPITKMLLSAVKSLQVQQFVTRKKKAGDSAAKLIQTWTLLASFFTYAAKEGYLQRNPCDNVPRPESPEKKSNITVFSNDEIKLLLSAAEKHKHRFLLYLALGTGAREGELSAATHADIAGGLLKITKSITMKRIGEGKATPVIGPPKSKSGFREIPITETVAREYKRHRAMQQEEFLRIGRGKLKDTDFLFINEHGRRLSCNSMAVMLKRVCETAGVESKKFHSLRHTYITKLVQSGRPLASVMELAGHSSIEQTMQYVHIENDQKLLTAQEIESIF